ncbi:hypothetical protein WG66_010075 [Moniliophthora roreri]|nr:hypothetical protein WG66_010075 [Moniliophthora roreri]
MYRPELVVVSLVIHPSCTPGSDCYMKKPMLPAGTNDVETPGERIDDPPMYLASKIRQKGLPFINGLQSDPHRLAS